MNRYSLRMAFLVMLLLGIPYATNAMDARALYYQQKTRRIYMHVDDLVAASLTEISLPTHDRFENFSFFNVPGFQEHIYRYKRHITPIVLMLAHERIRKSFDRLGRRREMEEYLLDRDFVGALFAVSKKDSFPMEWLKSRMYSVLRNQKAAFNTREQQHVIEDRWGICRCGKYALFKAPTTSDQK